MLGMLTKDQTIQANIPKSDRSQFAQTKWKFMLEAPFEISNRCCNVMKKSPMHSYTRKEQRYGITAQMASESRLRTQAWIQHGCNGFNMTNPLSNPMSFWFEQDVLLYIKLNHLTICSVYGDIVNDDGTPYSPNEEHANLGVFELERPCLKTTGCSRTGCVFCGFGCHLEKSGEGRFLRLKETHPNLYKYLFKPWDEGGLGYKEIIDWLNEHGNLNIEY